MRSLPVILVLLLAFLAGYARTELVVGGLYYVRDEKGAYSVLKILRTDNMGVHVRIYSNQFSAPPTQVDEGALYVAGPNGKPGEPPGMAHVPVLRQNFRRWNATFFQQSRVKSTELDDFWRWRAGKREYR